MGELNKTARTISRTDFLFPDKQKPLVHLTLSCHLHPHATEVIFEPQIISLRDYKEM